MTRNIMPKETNIIAKGRIFAGESCSLRRIMDGLPFRVGRFVVTGGRTRDFERRHSSRSGVGGASS
jgi:hypothetical protein